MNQHSSTLSVTATSYNRKDAMGRKQHPERVLVIGLDCGSPGLFFERWADELPHLTALRKRGLYGPLRSCHPPITVPAWRVMASGADAGQQGVFGFRNKASNYSDINLASSDQFHAEPIWETLGQHGLRSTIIGLPGTWPPAPLSGKMIAGPMTPDAHTNLTWPPSLATRVLKLAPTYAVDVRNFRHIEPHALIKQVVEMTRDRFHVARSLAGDDDWNLLWLVEIGLDRLYHALWHLVDPQHPKFEANPDIEQRGLLKALLDYHRLLDDEIASLMACCDDDDTTTLVVSDHGARSLHGGICLNVWLQRMGFQVLKPDAPAASSFDARWIDWSQTRAWAWGGLLWAHFCEPQRTRAAGHRLAR